MKEGNEILMSIVEHHYKIIVWKFFAGKTRVVLKFMNLNKDEVVDIE